MTLGHTSCRPVMTSFFSESQLVSTEMTLHGEESTHPVLKKASDDVETSAFTLKVWKSISLIIYF